MPRITYIEHDGTGHIAEVRAGLSVMEGAIKNGLPGIEARCGGELACATCHVYVDPAWTEAAGKPSAAELGMLGGVFQANERSRLSCQIRVTAALDGLVVHLPAFQG